jgi:hypothetical protein
VAINLVFDRRLADALHRIGRVLTVRYVERIEKNLIVKAGVR